MPELPDIKVYVDSLSDRIDGHVLEGMRVANPFVVRSVSPRPTEIAGLRVVGVGHQAKRVVIELEREIRILIHLMIAGRLHWRDAGAPLKGRNQLAALDFDSGALVLTEAGTKRRAAIHGEWLRLCDATRSVLEHWIDQLRQDAGAAFPSKVTAFRERMSVHGRYKKPCPVCKAPIQRIVYAENESNYCARCQTGGRMLADRSLSRLLKDNWPRKLEDLEE